MSFIFLVTFLLSDENISEKRFPTLALQLHRMSAIISRGATKFSPNEILVNSLMKKWEC
jgi:hypothetical protein